VLRAAAHCVLGVCCVLLVLLACVDILRLELENVKRDGDEVVHIVCWGLFLEMSWLVVETCTPDSTI
jgi:hypothetical protein